MKKIFAVMVSVALLIGIFPTNVLALGVAMAPATAAIDNALRGTEYERALTVFNPSKPETNYRLRVDGPAASWFSIYDFTSGEPIKNIVVAGESNSYVLLKVKIPPDIKNGSYNATVYAETAPLSAGGDNGVTAVMQAKSEWTIGVTGNQIITGVVNSVGVYDTEAGMPLRIDVNFENTGNVAVQPKIDCLINKGNVKVAEFSYNNTSVKPQSQENIRALWATTTADPQGDYTGRVTVTLDGKIIKTQDLVFKILPPGTFTQQGDLVNLSLQGKPTVGTMVKILADFKNTGEGDARAKLICELYKGGNLVDTVNSEETLVPVGQTGTLIAYLKPAQAAEYTIRGYVVYEGKQTAVKTMSITATGNSGSIDPGRWLPVVAVIGLVSIAGAAFVGLKRRKKAIN